MSKDMSRLSRPWAWFCREVLHLRDCPFCPDLGATNIPIRRSVRVIGVDNNISDTTDFWMLPIRRSVRTISFESKIFDTTNFGMLADIGFEPRELAAVALQLYVCHLDRVVPLAPGTPGSPRFFLAKGQALFASGDVLLEPDQRFIDSPDHLNKTLAVPLKVTRPSSANECHRYIPAP